MPDNDNPVDALLYDIDERARVAFLKAYREMGLDKHSPDLVDTFRTGFLGGYKMAMYDAVKIRLGLKKE